MTYSPAILTIFAFSHESFPSILKKMEIEYIYLEFQGRIHLDFNEMENKSI